MVESQLAISAPAAQSPWAVHPRLHELQERGSESALLHLDTLPWSLCALGEGLGVLIPWQVWECEAQPLAPCRRLASPPGLPWTRLGLYLEWPLLASSASLSCPIPAPWVLCLINHSHTSLSASDKPPGMVHFPGPSAQPCLQATRHMRAPAPSVTGLCPDSPARWIWGNLPQVLWLSQLSREGHPRSQAKSTENKAASQELSPSGPG